MTCSKSLLLKECTLLVAHSVNHARYHHVLCGIPVVNDVFPNWDATCARCNLVTAAPGLWSLREERKRFRDGLNHAVGDLNAAGNFSQCNTRWRLSPFPQGRKRVCASSSCGLRLFVDKALASPCFHAIGKLFDVALVVLGEFSALDGREPRPNVSQESFEALIALLQRR
jgi:hypothetical protein